MTHPRNPNVSHPALPPQFGSVIAAVWLLVLRCISAAPPSYHFGKHNTWPGVAGLIQVVAIGASSILLWLSAGSAGGY